MGVTVSHASLLAQCRALTQACGYLEGKGIRGTRELPLQVSDPVLCRTCPPIRCSRCRMLGALLALDE